jgi:hypothetical protein
MYPPAQGTAGKRDEIYHQPTSKPAHFFISDRIAFTAFLYVVLSGELETCT